MNPNPSTRCFNRRRRRAADAAAPPVPRCRSVLPRGAVVGVSPRAPRQHGPRARPDRGAPGAAAADAPAADGVVVPALRAGQLPQPPQELGPSALALACEETERPVGKSRRFIKNRVRNTIAPPRFVVGIEACSSKRFTYTCGRLAGHGGWVGVETVLCYFLYHASEMACLAMRTTVTLPKTLLGRLDFRRRSAVYSPRHRLVTPAREANGYGASQEPTTIPSTNARPGQALKD